MGTERERRAALHKHAPAAAATSYSRAEDSLERERCEAPARRGAEIAVGGVADERTICGCKQSHVTIEPPCPHGDHADRSRTATERRTADIRPQPRSATLPHDVKAGFNVGMGETGDIRVLAGSSGEAEAAARTGGGEAECV